MTALALYLLGPPRVERDGEEIHIGRRKAIALLAYLTLTGQRQQRDALATLLWPGYDQSTARAHLRRALAALTKRLGGEWLDADRETVGLHHNGLVWQDVQAFQQRLAECETHGHPLREVCPECVPHLEAALELYQGGFMDGFSLPDSLPFDDWQRFETEELRQALVSALERLVRGLSSQGAYEEALPHARRWVALDPALELAHRHLVLLYARVGQISAAFQQYHICERRMAEELGMPPSAELKALVERIHAGEDLGAVQPIGQVGCTAQTLAPHNLPRQSTPFVGREAELAELDALIADPEVRLITIVGPGGIGKTRLALAAAERQLSPSGDLKGGAHFRFPDGVYFVSLAALDSSARVAPALAEALDFPLSGRDGRTPEQQILGYVRRKRLLLVIDNFEHLLPPLSSLPSPAGRTTPMGGTEEAIERGSALLTEIVRAAPAVHILTTSRERLNLQGEQVYALQGLPCPYETTPPGAPANRAADITAYPAAQLFLGSARRARHGFAVTKDDLPYLGRICRLVDGMPLAVELAASWTDTLSLAAIASEIEQSLDFLETHWQDVPQRHRSITAVFDATWGRLSAAERDVFKQLSVFRGGFTRGAARAVTDASLRLLAGLVNKSLLAYNQAQDRYHAHELLRQYGAEKLARDPARVTLARERHSAYFCTALGRWETDLKSARQAVALDEIEADLANARAAWEWAAAQPFVTGLDKALRGYAHFYLIRGRFAEAIAACQLAIDALTQVDATAADFPDALRVAALAMVLQAELYHFDEQIVQAKTLLQRSSELLNSPALAHHDTQAERAKLLRKMGNVAMPDWDSARPLFEQSLSLNRLLGDRWEEAWSLSDLGYALLSSGDLEGAQRLFEGSLALLRALGDAFGEAILLAGLAMNANLLGDCDEAKRLGLESLVIMRSQGFRWGEVFSLISLGLVNRDSGDNEAAKQVYEECLALTRALGNPGYTAVSLLGLGGLTLDAYDVNPARRMFEEALSLSQADGYQAAIASALASMGHVALFQGQFKAGAEHLRQSVALDRDTGDLTAAAFELAFLGSALRWSGEFGQAETCFAEARALAEEMDSRPHLTHLALRRAQVNTFAGQYAEARAEAEAALTRVNALEDRPTLQYYFSLPRYAPRSCSNMGLRGLACGVLGWVALAKQRYAQALAPLKESITAFESIEDQEYVAWSLAALGRTTYSLGNQAEGHSYLLQALQTAVKIGAFMPLMHLMPIISALLADDEDDVLKEWAVELYALAESHSFVAHSQLFQDIAEKHIAAVAATLPPDVVEAAQARGQARDWWETAEELLGELKALGWTGSP
jgi:predicted ATPase/DNA-binding SARP family transcriptional activator